MTPTIVIGGPTAAGKSRLAMSLAESLGGEIVNADSVQVYRGFDIGSAKPDAAERARVPHHLLDILEADERYSAARFVSDAEAAIADIVARGAVPIVCGGTGLYLRSLVRGLFETPTDDAVRAAMLERLEGEGVEALHAELAQVDAEAAGRIGVRDAVRVVRALEVLQITGEPISVLQRRHALASARPNTLCVTLSRSRTSLHARIRARVAEMLEQGWIDEVRALRARGVGTDTQPMAAVGYREVAAHVEAGGGDADDALVDAIDRSTRRFAKRQLTWFRGQWTSRWVDAGDEAALREAHAAIEALVRDGRALPFGTDDDAEMRRR